MQVRREVLFFRLVYNAIFSDGWPYTSICGSCAERRVSRPAQPVALESMELCFRGVSLPCLRENRTAPAPATADDGCIVHAALCLSSLLFCNRNHHDKPSAVPSTAGGCIVHAALCRRHCCPVTETITISQQQHNGVRRREIEPCEPGSHARRRVHQDFVRRRSRFKAKTQQAPAAVRARTPTTTKKTRLRTHTRTSKPWRDDRKTGKTFATHAQLNKPKLPTVRALPAWALYRVTLTRGEVEEACAGVAEGVLGACREALRAAKLVAKDIQDVELLGGGSYIPLLRRSVESTFG